MSRCNCLYFLHHLIDLRRVRTTKVVKYPCSTFQWTTARVTRWAIFSLSLSDDQRQKNDHQHAKQKLHICTNRINNACTLVPTVFRWHGKREFKCHFRFSFSHDIEKQIWVLLFVFHFRPNFEKRCCTSYFVFRFRITSKNGYQFQFSFFVFAARSDKNVCKITTPRENGNVYHRVTALLIPRSGRQRPGFLAYPPPSGE